LYSRRICLAAQRLRVLAGRGRRSTMVPEVEEMGNASTGPASQRMKCAAARRMHGLW
jgi:hypothetical protein